MSVFAGAVIRTRNPDLLPRVSSDIRRHVSRGPDAVIEFKGPTFYLAKVDVGAFEAPGAHQDAEGNVSLLAGEPLIRERSPGAYNNREADLVRLHGQWIEADWSGLQECTGTFCAVNYVRETSRLTLIADKLGLRPIYYWATPEAVIFATALRILEQIRAVPLELDLRGVTEAAVFGFPLGERTPYTGISTIGAGETVQVSPDGIAKSYYWRWDKLPPVEEDIGEVARKAHRAFLAGIDRRLGGQTTAVAFLSGGLDSRTIAGALLERGVALHTLNHAPEETQDRVFADDIAGALGTKHHHLAPDLRSMYAFRGRLWNQGPVGRWFDSEGRTGGLRRVVWSGDGGSVGVGHVYLNDEIAQRAQRGDMGAAIDAFMSFNRQGVHAKMLRRDVASGVVGVPRLGIEEEVGRLECRDPGRALHLFLMLNDQRRHMVNLYEHIDQDRIELQLPFFDSDFLALILACPLDGFLRHSFYMRWLEYFPPVITSRAWQAYPGHVPCPHPAPEGLRYQWKNHFSKRMLNELRRTTLRELDRFMKSPTFPQTILDRRALRTAQWLTRLRVRDYGYVLKTAITYCRYAAGGSRWDGAGVG